MLGHSGIKSLLALHRVNALEWKTLFNLFNTFSARKAWIGSLFRSWGINSRTLTPGALAWTPSPFESSKAWLFPSARTADTCTPCSSTGQGCPLSGLRIPSTDRIAPACPWSTCSASNPWPSQLSRGCEKQWRADSSPQGSAARASCKCCSKRECPQSCPRPVTGGPKKLPVSSLRSCRRLGLA